jgi:hypothetical protein
LGVGGQLTPPLVGGEQLGCFGRIGQEQDRLDPSVGVVVGVAQGRQGVGDELNRGVEPGDDREGRADVEAAHAVLVGAGRAGELAECRGRLPLGGGDRIGGGDRAVHELLEPAPRDPPVGGFGDAGVDVGRLLDGQVAGATGHEARVGDPDLERLDPAPQLGQPDHEVEAVGHQGMRRPRAEPQPATQLSGAELGHVRSPDPTEALRTLAARQPGDRRIEGFGVVEDGVLYGGLQDLDVAAALGGRQVVDVVEELAPRHLVDRPDRLHAPSQAASTDKPAPKSCGEPGRSVTVR